MRTSIVVLIGLLLSACATGSFGQVEAYFKKTYLLSPLETTVAIPEQALHVKGKYAVLRAPPTLEDGSAAREYFEDIDYVVCLEKQRGTWNVIYDLSRSDVPSAKELEHIRQTFPAAFPKLLLPPFWQTKLKEER